MAGDDRLLTTLVARIREARRLTVLTGAGVSAASGVPTFRGADGLWKQYRATELATPEAFARDPRLVWEWYAWRRDVVARCRPNAAHLALARLAIARDADRGAERGRATPGRRPRSRRRAAPRRGARGTARRAARRERAERGGAPAGA